MHWICIKLWFAATRIKNSAVLWYNICIWWTANIQSLTTTFLVVDLSWKSDCGLYVKYVIMTKIEKTFQGADYVAVLKGPHCIFVILYFCNDLSPHRPITYSCFLVPLIKNHPYHFISSLKLNPLCMYVYSGCVRTPTTSSGCFLLTETQWKPDLPRGKQTKVFSSFCSYLFDMGVYFCKVLLKKQKVTEHYPSGTLIMLTHWDHD